MAIVASVVGSCAVPGMSVAVMIPRLPRDYCPDQWHVRWWDGATVRQLVLASNSCGEEMEALSLGLDRSGAILPVVIMKPVGGPHGTIPLAPYGGWPAHEDGVVRPDRHGGELASVLLAVAEAGIDPSLINVTRLDSLFRSRIDTHPRRLDTVRLVSALAGRSMGSYHVSERGATLHQIRLPLPPEVIVHDDDPDPDETLPPDYTPVPWLSDDTAEPSYRPAPAGAYELFSVPVLNGEVRRLWRPCQGEDCYQVLVVHQTPAGNTYHSIMELAGAGKVISPRSSPVYPAPR